MAIEDPFGEFFELRGGTGGESLFRADGQCAEALAELAQDDGQFTLMAAFLLPSPDERAEQVMVHDVFEYRHLRDLRSYIVAQPAQSRKNHQLSHCLCSPRRFLFRYPAKNSANALAAVGPAREDRYYSIARKRAVAEFRAIQFSDIDQAEMVVKRGQFHPVDHAHGCGTDVNDDLNGEVLVKPPGVDAITQHADCDGRVIGALQFEVDQLAGIGFGKQVEAGAVTCGSSTLRQEVMSRPVSRWRVSRAEPSSTSLSVVS